MPNGKGTDGLRRPVVQVFVATTVMLTFISFWRAAAIVLADLASSAYYVPGIAETAIGKSAPWFILAVMLFSYAVRALYIESSTMFVRGGVYRVVKEAMGGGLAKVAVSALMFDFVLTGPISAVSAGQYLAGLIQDASARFGHALVIPTNHFAAVFAVGVTVYFWWQNILGIHETSEKALRIMQITTVMVVILILWSLFTLTRVGVHLPPAPVPRNMVFPKESLGWLYGSGVTKIAVLALLIGFGHSILAMSGEETLAQVYREIESPKVRNLEKAGLVIFIYTLLFTSLSAFFAVMIIPDNVRARYLDNILGGLSMYLAGPYLLRLLFQAFVVIVGVLILAGAVNTAIIGSNGVLNRVSEDGVMTDWFRRPHRRYGTTYRIINLIVGLQLLIIIASRGDVYLLGEGYAFGLIWSFTFLAVSVLILRFTHKEPRQFKIPGNIQIGETELPIALMFITFVLVSTAVMNLFTKRIATISGVIFTVGFFIVFEVSQRMTRRKQLARMRLDQFRVSGESEIAAPALRVRPGNVLVTVRDPQKLYQLDYMLRTVDTTKQDVVVMTVRLYRGAFTAPSYIDEREAFDEYEQELFTKVVSVAERAGKPVSLLVVPGTNVFQSIVLTAQKLESSTVIAGLSNYLSVEQQGKLTGDAWERLPEPRPRLTLQIVSPDGSVTPFHLGPHTPRLRPEDLELMHNIWLEITSDPAYHGLHHYDIVALALQQLQGELHSDKRELLLNALRELSNKPRLEQPMPR